MNQKVFELVNKVETVAVELFELIPGERVKHFLEEVFVYPAQRAFGQLNQSELSKKVTDELQEMLKEMVDGLNAETVSFFVLMFLMKLEDKEIEEAVEVMEILDYFDEVKPMIESVFKVFEKNAPALGKIVEDIILFGYNFKNDIEAIESAE